MITPFDPPPEKCRWRAVVGFPSYQVSEYGHIRRATTTSQGANPKGKILKPKKCTGGYAGFGLWLDKHTRKDVLSHRLVLMAFVGPPPKGKMCAHYDGTRTNNHVSNLRWATRKENGEDMVRHGRSAKGDRHNFRMYPEIVPRGEAHPSAKLCNSDIKAIRKSKAKQRDLATKYGVDQALIWRIRKRLIWRHVQ